MAIRISGVILAGGAGKRYGGIIKSNLIVEGETIISRILSVINDIFEEKIIVTNNTEEFRGLDQCRIIGDHYQKAGPLGGIHAALKSTSAEAILVFAGDMPFLDKNIIKDQVSNFNSGKYDVLVPRIGKFIEPLHAIYSRQIEKSLDRYLAEGRSRSVKDFLSELNIGYFVIPDTKAGRRVFTNINSPSDITGLRI